MIDFTVEPEHGDPYEVTADSRDIYVWEKTNRGKTMKDLVENQSMVDMYALAWRAARRLGLTDAKTADAFAETCVLDFDIPDDVDPTQPEALREA